MAGAGGRARSLGAGRYRASKCARMHRYAAKRSKDGVCCYALHERREVCCDSGDGSSRLADMAPGPDQGALVCRQACRAGRNGRGWRIVGSCLSGAQARRWSAPELRVRRRSADSSSVDSVWRRRDGGHSSRKSWLK